MAGVFKYFKGGTQNLAHNYAKVYAPAKILEKASGYKPAEQTMPGAPNLDGAADTAATAELDRIKRRRGVLANIYGGSVGGGNPSVGTSTLGGG